LTGHTESKTTKYIDRKTEEAQTQITDIQTAQRAEKRQPDRQTDKHADIQTAQRKDSQIGRQTNMQTYRQHRENIAR
jgi:hypothetical protein